MTVNPNPQGLTSKPFPIEHPSSYFPSSFNHSETLFQKIKPDTPQFSPHAVRFHWKQQVSNWREEDILSLDYGGRLRQLTECHNLSCKSDSVFASQPFANQVYQECGLTGEWPIKEAKFLEPSKMKDGKIKDGDYRSTKHSLQAERYSLNVAKLLARDI
ncbi:unnamed protein product [Ambrosiozyma monospora]|uniref:Unnamed protein product n=1 Tax=Ambrosiozyma monospora TaxID=43982 RepID=A0ACB5T058_AMBMO|nr:unnamed protein product [Ambrosiozyma monospora]